MAARVGDVDSLFTPAARRPGAPGQSPAKPPGARLPGGAGGPPGGSAPGLSAATAEELSRRYQQSHRLDYRDRIPDGFCDIVGSGVVVDRSRDENLEICIIKAQKKMQKASDNVTAVMVLGLLVSEACGRSGSHAADLVARSRKRLVEQRGGDGRVMLGRLFGANSKKIKVLGAAGAETRALTFKVMAEALLAPECTLERDATKLTAWNTVQLNGVSYVVDLMHDPGAMYEAGSPKEQEYVRLLGSGFAALTTTLSTQQEFAGRVPRPSWHVESGDLKYSRDAKDRLGKGGFGEVLKGTWADCGVAIKIITAKDPTDYDIMDFILEIALLSRLSHPNVMRFWRGCAELSNGHRALLMVTEHIDKGGLSGLLHGHGGPALAEALSLPQIFVITMGIARGMQYLHGCSVLHLDLKSPNVLIDSAWTPKLCDFGLAKISGKETAEGFQTTLRGVSPIWAPPEMFDDQADSMTEKADVYSFGIVFFEIAVRALPFQDIGQRHLPKAKYEGMLPTIPKIVPEDCGALIKECCTKIPAMRPTMITVVAKLQDFVSIRNLCLADVVMPLWQQPRESAAEQEAVNALKERQVRLNEERRSLLVQLEKAREQRKRVQEAHLGTGVPEEEAMPVINPSPPAAKEQAKPQGRSALDARAPADGAAGAGSPGAKGAGKGASGKDQACCAAQ